MVTYRKLETGLPVEDLEALELEVTLLLKVLLIPYHLNRSLLSHN